MRRFGRMGGRFPCLDFAGGTVVHVTSGVSALIAALYLGNRVGYPQESMAPHSVVLSFVGACLLWGILFVVDKVIGLRVSEEDERTGLDLSQHDEEGYDFAT